MENFNLSLFTAGDAKEFTRVHDRFINEITAYVRKRLREDQPVRDCVCDIFAALWKNVHKFDSLLHIQRWLFWLAKIRTVDYFQAKSQTRKEQEAIAALVATADLPVTYQEHPALTLADVVYLMRRHRLLLSSTEQQIVEMMVLGKKTADEIALELGKKPNTVKVTIKHALDKIKSGNKKRRPGKGFLLIWMFSFIITGWVIKPVVCLMTFISTIFFLHQSK